MDDDSDFNSAHLVWPWLRCLATGANGSAEEVEAEAMVAENFMVAIADLRGALEHLDNGVDSLAGIASFRIRKLVMREVFCSFREAFEAVVTASDEFGNTYDLRCDNE